MSRIDQWVAPSARVVSVASTTRLITSSVSCLRRPGRVASWVIPSTPWAAIRSPPQDHGGTGHPELLGDGVVGATLDRCKSDPRSQHHLLRCLRRPDQPLELRLLFLAEIEYFGGCPRPELSLKCRFSYCSVTYHSCS